jgi:hypothetical protein
MFELRENVERTPPPPPVGCTRLFGLGAALDAVWSIMCLSFSSGSVVQVWTQSAPYFSAS